MVFELACLVVFVGPAGMLEYRESTTVGLLTGTADRKGALTRYDMVCLARWRLSRDCRGFGWRCLFAGGAQFDSETGFSASLVISPRLGMKSDSDGLWSLVVAN